jgi:hypothetical protein
MDQLQNMAWPLLVFGNYKHDTMARVHTQQHIMGFFIAQRNNYCSFQLQL